MALKIKTVYYKTRSERFKLRKKAASGLRMIGSGAFASTYAAANSKTVTKIGNLPDKYLNYLKEIVKAPSSPFLPVVHSATIYRPAKGARNTVSYGRDHGFYVVKMERLQKVSGSKKIDAYGAVSMISSLVQSRAETLEKAIINHVGATVAIPGVLTVEVNRDVVSSLATAIGAMKRAKAKGGWWDLHTGNIMRRGMHQVVITDPLA